MERLINQLTVLMLRIKDSEVVHEAANLSR